jgi:Predicted glycosyltransferases
MKKDQIYKALLAHVNYVLPAGSQRRLLAKLAFRCVARAKQLMRLLTWQNCQKIKYYMANGGWRAILSRIDYALQEKLPHTEIRDNTDIFIQLAAKSGAPDKPPVGVIDIVIPIYNAYEFTRDCMEAVCDNTDLPYHLRLINDASPDRRIAELLREIARRPKPENLQELTVITNQENLGFIATVNKGIAISQNHVVLLNTDTKVPPHWLSRLVRPLLADPLISSVTPFSNSATICSFPDFCQDNELILDMTVEQIDALFARFGAKEPVELPSGVGFCLLLNRSALDAVGLFDAATFGKGYGEENDWCMRAKKAGYKNVISPDLFVYHKHGASFGERQDKSKQQRLAENMLKLEQKHPDYLPWGRRFFSADPLRGNRQIMLNAFYAQKFRDKPGILFISNSLGGGTKLYQDKLIEVNKTVKRVYILELQPNRHFVKLSDLQVGRENDYLIRLAELSPQLFRVLLEMLRVDLIYINQLVGYPVDQMFDLISGSGIRYLYFIHDYFAVCPSFNLINCCGNYCHAETDSARCQKCLDTHLYSEPWIGMSAREINIADWRGGFARVLAGAHRVIAPSRSAKDIVSAYYPRINIEVREHALAFDAKNTFESERLADSQLNLAFIGAIGVHKGLKTVYELRERIKEEKLPIKITVIGTTNLHFDPYTSEDGLFTVTGPYHNDELPVLLAKHRVSLVGMPCIWPETYSYTTSEAIYSGYPVITFDFGAPAERVKRYDCGWIAEKPDTESFLRILKRLLVNRSEIAQKAENCRMTVGSDQCSGLNK